MTKRTEWGKEILRLDGGHCQNPDCTWGSFSTRCQPHHIIHKSLGGEDVVENGISLCAQCHDWVHSGHRGRDGWVSGREMMISVLESHQDETTFRWGKTLAALKRKRK